MLDITVKAFDKLTTIELYEILKLRSQVFVVEQDCVYQDLDNKDKEALHVIGFDADKIVAYTRIFNTNTYFTEASIGRVVVDEAYRKKGLGLAIMKASIEAVKVYFKTNTIKISAQTYLIKFYNSLGFKVEGSPYLEDGIPHTAMIKY